VQLPQRGYCDGVSGSCVCLNSSAAGFFGGPSCAVCDPWYSSTGCSVRCPGLANPCSAHGTCFDGVCSCFYGYGGADCATPCPGSGSPCTGHGVCSGITSACTCQSNSSGFWTGAGCDACVTGWSGPQCNLACPTTLGVICAGHGLCASGACNCATGYCGAACQNPDSSCLSCPAGYFGPTCSGVCPGGAATPCSGHGLCSQGTGGDGKCVCALGYTGPACDAICAGGLVNPCQGHGTCDATTNGRCSCDPYYGLADCSALCPGAPLNACSGHGTCFAGSTNTAECICVAGYTSADCSGICPGGLATPCNNKGVCNRNGTCTCYAANSTGFWVGATCNACAPGYVGANCDLQCARGPNGQQCNSRGVCKDTATCQCAFNDTAVGFWSGLVCEACLSGYYGLECDQECPGGACDVCSGHGECGGGRYGSGACTCYANSTAGFWAVPACADCAATYWGEKCLYRCPNNRSTCGGHGNCSEGIGGNGTCLCSTGWATNTFDGECTKCASGFYGFDCRACGRNANVTVTCSGRGTCSDGIAGNGTCACASNAAGTYCQYVCPSDSNGACGGHGTCAPTGCNCSTGWLLDSSTLSCTICSSGYFGASCAVCPNCSCCQLLPRRSQRRRHVRVPVRLSRYDLPERLPPQQDRH
jgi:hypothetical protein